MPQVFLAALLMTFLLWSYKVLNKNFMPQSTDPIEKISKAKASLQVLKRLALTLLLFIGCYLFIGYAAQDAKYEVVEELRQEQTQMQNQGKIDEHEIIQNYEQNKSQHMERNRQFRIITPNEIDTKFKDVAGLTEAKDEVMDVVRFLRDPVAFSRLGAKAPKGLLLYGVPGTGKTLMARAIAGEAGVSFIAVAGAEFDEEFIGVGAARIRQLFAVARQHAPCIIFIDEVDALAHKRTPHDPAWSAQTVNQLLAEMDGLDSSKNEGVVVIAATNRLDVIEPAVLRPGRLDRHIKLDLPTLVHL